MKRLIIFYFLLGLLSACSKADFDQCESYVVSILEIRDVLKFSLGKEILTIYPAIWSIMVARKILL